MNTVFLEEMSADEKRQIIQDAGGDTEHLLSVLLELQSHSGTSSIDEATAELVADELHLSPTHVHDAITFYEMLDAKPSARYTINICKSAPCYYAKAAKPADLLKEILGISPGETTPDGMFRIRYCSCFGACDMSPAIKIGDDVYGNLTLDSLRKLIDDLRAR